MSDEKPKYYDLRADFWRAQFEAARGYEEYLASGDPAKAERWPAMESKLPPLTAEQSERVRGHNRKMNVLFYSGVWCGDCVRQGPMIRRIAGACGPGVVLRFIDRDASPQLRDELRILGAMRVPVAVFLSEDFFEIGRFGDRMLTVYRAKARREVGAACSAGIFAPPADELAAETGDWIDVFERMLLMLRLSPMLRGRYGD
jgi:thiol-disulfide isomerase/thioredoxin